MPVTLDATAPDFEAAFDKLLNAKREDSPDVDDTVAAIIADVRARGIRVVPTPWTMWRGSSPTGSSFSATVHSGTTEPLSEGGLAWKANPS